MSVDGQIEVMDENGYTLTGEQTAEMLGVTTRSVARYCEAGARAREMGVDIPRSLVCKKVRSDKTQKWLVERHSVEKFLNRLGAKVADSGQDPRLDSGPISTRQTPPQTVETVHDSARITQHLREEAGRWKGKYEGERDARIRADSERTRKEDAHAEEMRNMSMQLGGAQMRVETLEKENRLLTAGDQERKRPEDAVVEEEPTEEQKQESGGHDGSESERRD